MGTKYTTKTDKLPQLVKNLKSLRGRSVEIGALQGDSKWLAAIHEYGCDIPVTPKMRAFLATQGLHLKATTTHIHIPERSFIRAGHDENADRIMKQTERAICAVLDGAMSVDDLLDLCGQQFATAIKLYMRDLRDPANHPFTVEQKGSSNPLIDTGGLLESITWRKN